MEEYNIEVTEENKKELEELYGTIPEDLEVVEEGVVDETSI